MKDKQAALAKAFDDASYSGKLFALNEEEANTLIDYVRDESALLKAARVVRMSKPVKTIGKLVANGRFLHPGGKGVVLTEDQRQGFSADSIELKSEGVKGVFRVYDEELEDNVEGAVLGEHLVRIVAKKLSNELEEISYKSRKLASPAGENAVLNMFDGFRHRIRQNGHVVNAADTGLFADRKVSKEKFVRARKSLPTKFRSGTKFFTQDDVIMDYALLFDANFNRNAIMDNVVGTPFVSCPLMSVDNPVPDGGASTTASGSGNTAGQNTLTITSATGISNGKHLVVGYGTAAEQVYTVASVSGSVATLTSNLVYAVPNGTTVKTCTLDGVDSILTDPMNLIYGLQIGDGGFQFEMERIAAASAWDYHFRMRMDFQVEEPTAAVLLENLLIN